MSNDETRDKINDKLEELSGLIDSLEVGVKSEIDEEGFNMLADIHKEKIENYILKHSELFDTTREVDLTNVSADRVLDYAFAFGTLYDRMVGKDAIKRFWNNED